VPCAGVASEGIPRTRENLHEGLAQVSVEARRKKAVESDPRVAEGDTLSLVILLMDYSQLVDKLAKAADDECDISTAWAMTRMGTVYRDAAYQAGRICVDQVPLDLVSKSVSEVHRRHNRMELETVTVRRDGLRLLREFKKVAITARTKHAATKAAAVPVGTAVTETGTSRRATQRASAKKKVVDSKRHNFARNGTPEPPIQPSRQAAEERPGATEYPQGGAGPDMTGNPRPRRGGGAGCGLARVGAAQVQHHGNPEPRGDTMPIRLDAADSAEMEAVIDKRLHCRIWRELSRPKPGGPPTGPRKS
jgi:hypothetical protein